MLGGGHSSSLRIKLYDQRVRRTYRAARRVLALTSATRTGRALAHMRTECSLQDIPLISMLLDEIQPHLTTDDRSRHEARNEWT